MSASTVKDEVRRFYDSIGWARVGEGLFQNARYEDLRPVSQEYLHRCHLRVGEHLPPRGRYLLDVGSGPIQYPEYLTYSAEFEYRVCLDISHRALLEARQRIGAHGLYVVGDAAHLPFVGSRFDGLVSLHTVHHLPPSQQETAYREFYRTLAPGGRAATVYSWGEQSPLTAFFEPFIRISFWCLRQYRRLLRQAVAGDASGSASAGAQRATGTYTHKHTYQWMSTGLSDLPGFQIRVWRSVSTQFLRAFIHRQFFGRFWLRLIFTLEDAFPKWFGRVGQYPLITFHKPGLSQSS